MAESKLKKEPVTVGGLILGVVTAVGPALVAFGVDLSAEQLATGQALVLAVIALVIFVVRGKVTPVHSIVEDAKGELEEPEPVNDEALGG